MHFPARPERPLAEFFETAFQERIARSPQLATALGIKRDYDRLDDLSDAKLDEDRKLVEDQLQRLRAYDYAALTPADRLNYRLFESDAQMRLKRFRYRYHDYLVNQKFGLHTDFPAFMINMHGIDCLQDARDYLARLRALPRACTQVLQGLDKRESLGIIPPAYLFPQMLDDCRRFVAGTEDDEGLERHALFADFRSKLENLVRVSLDLRQALLQEARQVLREYVLPVYRRLIAYLERQAPKAPQEAGASSLPDGHAYYQMCLERHTSTGLSADEIHELGINEVARIRQEIRALQPQLGFQGDLADLFAYAREREDFYFPQTADGRQACLDKLNRHTDAMAPRLPALFNILPQDALLIKPVEPHRERTAGLAFYEGPAADGSRPGIFYVNLYDLRQLPIFAVEALAYHEALPGHHLQFSIANRLHALPSFRRYLDYTAYVEGWGLYSERLAKEIGLYEDPWSDFGRLTQELKRACRLVVDTGLHAKAWTRHQAIEYLHDNTPSSLGQVVKEVDRYIVMPGQATSYKVGMEEILRLRRQAQALLQDRFDLRAFHTEMLRHGPLPLSLLEEQIQTWALDPH